MTYRLLGAALVLCLASGVAEARKPVKQVTLEKIDPPRAVPGPIAGAGLPATVLLGLYGWRVTRRGKEGKFPSPDRPA